MYFSAVRPFEVIPEQAYRLLPDGHDGVDKLISRRFLLVRCMCAIAVSECMYFPRRELSVRLCSLIMPCTPGDNY